MTRFNRKRRLSGWVPVIRAKSASEAVPPILIHGRGVSVKPDLSNRYIIGGPEKHLGKSL